MRSCPESLTLIAAQHEDWIIRQAITLLENRVFKAGPALGSPAAVRSRLTQSCTSYGFSSNNGWNKND